MADGHEKEGWERAKYDRRLHAGHDLTRAAAAARISSGKSNSQNKQWQEQQSE